MAQKSWKRKLFSPETIDRAVYAVEVAFKSGLVVEEDVSRLVGYVMETILQKGYGKVEIRSVQKEPNKSLHRWTNGPWKSHVDGKLLWDVSVDFTVAAVAQRAIRGGHKYASGRNRQNYLGVGRKLIAGIAPRVGLVESTDTMVVLDFLNEMLGEKPTEFKKLLNEDTVYELKGEVVYEGGPAHIVDVAG